MAQNLTLNTRRAKRRVDRSDAARRSTLSRASICAHSIGDRARLSTTTSRVAGFSVARAPSRARRPPGRRARGSLRRATRGESRTPSTRERCAEIRRDARASSGARGARAARGRVDIARRRARGQTRARSIGGNARRARSIGEARARARRARGGGISRGVGTRANGANGTRARAEGRVRGGLIGWGICGRGAVRTAVVDARARRWGAGGRAGCVRGKRTDDRRA